MRFLRWLVDLVLLPFEFVLFLILALACAYQNGDWDGGDL